MTLSDKKMAIMKKPNTFFDFDVHGKWPNKVTCHDRAILTVWLEKIVYYSEE